MIFIKMKTAGLGLALLAGGIALTALPAPVSAQQYGQPNGQYREDPGTALNRHLRTLADQPRSLHALMGAGKAALELGDPKAALTFFARAEEIAPRDGRVKAGMGASFLQMEQPVPAMRFFQDAAALGVPEAEFAGDRGLAFDLAGDQRRAQADYANSLRREENPEVRRRLALSLAISGERDKALATIDDQLRRHDRAAWRTRAFILALSGDAAEATRTTESVMPGLAGQLSPFFAKLASLNPAQRAMAVHYGHMPTAAQLAAQAPYAGTQYARAAPVTAPAPQQPASNSRRRSQAAEPASNQPRRRAGAQEASAAPSKPRPPASWDRYDRWSRYESEPARTPKKKPEQAAPAVASRGQAQTRVQPPAAAPRPVATAQAPVQLPVPQAPVLAPRPAPVQAAPVQQAPLPQSFATAPLQPQPQVVQPVPAQQAPLSVPQAIAAAPIQAPPAQAATEVAQPGLIGPPAAEQPAPAQQFAQLPQPSASAPAILPVPLAPSQVAEPAPQPARTGDVPAPVASSPADTAPEPAFSEIAAAIAKLPTETAPAASAEDRSPPAAPPARKPTALAQLDAKTSARVPAPAATEAKTKPSATKADQPKAAKKEEPVKKEEPRKKKDASAAKEEPKKGGSAKNDSRKDEAAKKKETAKKAPAKPEPKAPSRIWVQIAGGADKGALPREYARMKDRAPKLLAARSAWTTPLRFTNRLLVGPFKSEKEAQDLVNELNKQGFSAFTWTSPAGQEIEKLAVK